VVGVGDSEAVGDGDSDSDGAGEPFLLRCGDALGLGDGDGVSSGAGVGEIFFFRWEDALAVGEGDSSCAADAFFFFGEAPGVAEGDSSLVGDFFFFGDGDDVGVGVDGFFDEAVTFFFLCGVGVGVEKIFFRVLPNDCSAAWPDGATNEKQTAKTKARKIM